MAAAMDSVQQAQWRAWRGVAELYDAFFTGLILTVVTRHDGGRRPALIWSVG